MFKSQKGKNLAAVVFKVNVIMNHQCKDFFFLLEFLSFALSVSQLLLQQKKKAQNLINWSVLINYLANKIVAQLLFLGNVHVLACH